MKKLITYTAAIIMAFISQTVYGQEFTYDLGNNAGQAIEFTLSRSDISIEGHNSNQVIIENEG
jgi:hypothetical protein